MRVKQTLSGPLWYTGAQCPSTVPLHCLRGALLYAPGSTLSFKYIAPTISQHSLGDLNC